MSKEDKGVGVSYDFSGRSSFRRAALWAIAIVVALVAAAILIGKGD